MKNSLIVLLTYATLVTVSCKKDKEETQAVTKENLAGSYKLAALKVQVNGSVEEDAMSSIEACQADDVTTLNADQTYTVADAGTQCSPATDESGNWGLAGTTSFIMDGETFAIKSWNGKQLVLTETDNSSGTSITYTTTLNKQ